ncbi:hypothetical protein WMY93_034114, partial [Mugilogobius chulae]
KVSAVEVCGGVAGQVGMWVRQGLGVEARLVCRSRVCGVLVEGLVVSRCRCAADCVQVEGQCGVAGRVYGVQSRGVRCGRSRVYVWQVKGVVWQVEGLGVQVEGVRCGWLRVWCGRSRVCGVGRSRLVWPVEGVGVAGRGSAVWAGQVCGGSRGVRCAGRGVAGRGSAVWLVEGVRWLVKGVRCGRSRVCGVAGQGSGVAGRGSAVWLVEGVVWPLHVSPHTRRMFGQNRLSKWTVARYKRDLAPNPGQPHHRNPTLTSANFRQRKPAAGHNTASGFHRQKSPSERESRYTEEETLMRLRIITSRGRRAGGRRVHQKVQTLNIITAERHYHHQTLNQSWRGCYGAGLRKDALKETQQTPGADGGRSGSR